MANAGPNTNGSQVRFTLMTISAADTGLKACQLKHPCINMHVLHQPDCIHVQLCMQYLAGTDMSMAEVVLPYCLHAARLCERIRLSVKGDPHTALSTQALTVHVANTP